MEWIHLAHDSGQDRVRVHGDFNFRPSWTAKQPENPSSYLLLRSDGSTLCVLYRSAHVPALFTSNCHERLRGALGCIGICSISANWREVYYLYSTLPTSNPQPNAGELGFKLQWRNVKDTPHICGVLDLKYKDNFEFTGTNQGVGTSSHPSVLSRLYEGTLPHFRHPKGKGER